MSRGMWKPKIATASAVANPAAAAFGADQRNKPSKPSSTRIGSAATSVEMTS